MVGFSPEVLAGDRAEVEAHLAELPVAAPDMAPAQRHEGSRSSFRRQLLQTDRDFTAEDYEALLELDADVRRHRPPEEAAFASALLEHLPVSIVGQGTTAMECSVCLEVMSAGAEVR